MSSGEFYTDKYGAESSLQKHLKSGLLSARDVSLIREYVSELKAQKHISEARVRKIVFSLVAWRRFLPSHFDQISMGDVYVGIDGVKTGKSEIGKPFSQNTLHDLIKILKPFLLWLVESEYVKLPEKKIAKITAPPIDYRTSDPEDLYTEDDFKKLIDACTTARDRAFISTLYESGVRIGELCRMRWKDLSFEEYGAGMIIDDAKTRKNRFVPLTMSAHYLATWKADTIRKDPSDFVFVQFTPEAAPFTYVTVRKLMNRLKKKTGITKKLRPHLFRKSRITDMIKQNYQESIIKEMCWGNVNTQQFQTYVVLSSKDITDEVLERQGIRRKPSAEEKGLAPHICLRCNHVNPPKESFCLRCGMPTTTEAAVQISQMQRVLMKNPDVLKELLTLMNLNQNAPNSVS